MLFCVQEGRLAHPCIRAKFFNRVCEKYGFLPLKGKRRSVLGNSSQKVCWGRKKDIQNRGDWDSTGQSVRGRESCQLQKKSRARWSRKHAYSSLVESLGDGDRPGAPEWWRQRSCCHQIGKLSGPLQPVLGSILSKSFAQIFMVFSSSSQI